MKLLDWTSVSIAGESVGIKSAPHPKKSRETTEGGGGNENTEKVKTTAFKQGPCCSGFEVRKKGGFGFGVWGK